jgi:hypothetical protein
VSIAILGPFSKVQARLEDGRVVVGQTSSSRATRLAQGSPVRVHVDADAVLVVPG